MIGWVELLVVVVAQVQHTNPAVALKLSNLNTKLSCHEWFAVFFFGWQIFLL